MYVHILNREAWGEKSKFSADAQLLLDYIGGKSNIRAVTHCVTRMRFVLNDPKRADIKKIEDLESTKGTFTQSGQFQVIIGNEVDDYCAFGGTILWPMIALSNIALPFTLTTVIGNRKLTKRAVRQPAETLPQQNEDQEEFQAPMTGTLYKLSSIEDQAFASGAMGDGIAVELTQPSVVAPLSGEIIVCFPTNHAYGLRTQGGKEILIHIGMDTVELNGAGFTSHVKVGDRIKQGDMIAEVDLDYVRSQNKSLVSPVVFTDGSKIEVLQELRQIELHERNLIKFI